MKAPKQARRIAKRLFRLCMVDHLLDEGRLRQVVQRVGAARHRQQLAILRYLQRLAELYVARHTAIVQSAAMLPADLEVRVRTELGQVYGPGIATRYFQRPDLIGGMRIQVGSDVYDGSIRAGLDALAASV